MSDPPILCSRLCIIFERAPIENPFPFVLLAFFVSTGHVSPMRAQLRSNGTVTCTASSGPTYRHTSFFYSIDRHPFISVDIPYTG
jgi:hypothetical protein